MDCESTAIVVEIDPGGDDPAQHALLFLDQAIGVDQGEVEFRAHRQVLLENAGLKDAEAFLDIGGKSEIHAGFEVLQLGPVLHDPVERGFQIGLEEEDDIGSGCEIVNASHPVGRTAPHGVPGEGGIDITVAQDDVTGAQQGHQLPFVTIGEIGGVDEAESRRGK